MNALERWENAQALSLGQWLMISLDDKIMAMDEPGPSGMLFVPEDRPSEDLWALGSGYRLREDDDSEEVN